MPNEPLYDLESVAKRLESKLDSVDVIEEKPTISETEEEDVIVVDEEKEDEEKKEDQPKQKKTWKRDHRIEGLLKKNTAKDGEIEELKKKIDLLSQKDQERENKETDATIKELETKKKEAFESADYEEFKKYEDEMNKIGRQENVQMSGDQIMTYFKSKNPWYGVDQIRSNVAENLHSKIIGDPKYRHLNGQEQLDLVTSQINDMPQFKKNPWQNSSPSEGAPLTRPSEVVTSVTRSDIESVRRMYPELSDLELKSKTKFLKEAVIKNQEKI